LTNQYELKGEACTVDGVAAIIRVFLFVHKQ